MRRMLMLVVLMVLGAGAWASPWRVVVIAEDATRTATLDRPVHLASGELSRWNPGDPAMVMSQRSDGRWQIELEVPEEIERVNFKFARGSWDRVETDASFDNIDNRALVRAELFDGLAPGVVPVVELVIRGWADLRPGATVQTDDPYRALEVTGTVRRVQVRGGGAGMARAVREVLVWLPAGYREDAPEAYPVLYLLDGQNVFEQRPGGPEEWRADEIASGLVASGRVRPFVIVAVPHGGVHRGAEYLPLAAYGVGDADGDGFVRFLMGEVIPRVERSFRVRDDAGGRVIGGASLGAVAALHACVRHPGAFGGLLLESPSTMSEARGAWLEMVGAMPARPARVVIGYGGRETGGDDRRASNEAYVRSARELAGVLRGIAPVPGRGLGGGAGADAGVVERYERRAGHNEAAWSGRLERAMLAFFGRPG